jgi:Replication-relaxation
MLPTPHLNGKSSRRPLTPWELPTLLAPVHTYRRSRRTAKKERGHFPAILAFVYRNRFAVASQIQRRFAGTMRSDRTTRRHLDELEALGFLCVAPGRGLSPLFPKVFYVTKRGLRRLKNSLAKQGRSWNESCVDRGSRDVQEGYASDRIIHELLITEFLLAVWQTVEGRPDLELLKIERRSLAKHDSYRVTINGRPTRLVPDAMFIFLQQGRGLCGCFLELDNGSMNAKQLRAKYARYAAWSQSAQGQQYLIDLYRRCGAKEPRPTFRLLIVARSRTGLDDDSRLAELLAAAKHAPSLIRERLWLTTVAALAGHQHDQRPMERRLWVRARDPNGIAVSSSLRRQVSTLPRHALAPPVIVPVL